MRKNNNLDIESDRNPCTEVFQWQVLSKKKMNITKNDLKQVAGGKENNFFKRLVCISQKSKLSIFFGAINKVCPERMGGG